MPGCNVGWLAGYFTTVFFILIRNRAHTQNKTKQEKRKKIIVIVSYFLQDSMLLFDTSLKYVRLNISCGDEEGASNYIIC